MAQADRKKALDIAIKEIEKQHGKGSVMILGNEDLSIGIETISTGSILLDKTTQYKLIFKTKDVVSGFGLVSIKAICAFS